MTFWRRFNLTKKESAMAKASRERFRASAAKIGLDSHVSFNAFNADLCDKVAELEERLKALEAT